MSTLLYAELTSKRDAAQPGRSQTDGQPGVKTYVDALAALVPAEVLTVHGVILTVTTAVDAGVTTITHPQTLAVMFWVLLVMATGLYAAWRLYHKRWDDWDWLRMLLPPLSLLGWLMLQRSTAFDAVWPTLDAGPRTAAAVVLAVVLGAAAVMLAYKADQSDPKPPPVSPGPPPAVV
jgi:hypothetical protein